MNDAEFDAGEGDPLDNLDACEVDPLDSLEVFDVDPLDSLDACDVDPLGRLDVCEVDLIDRAEAAGAVGPSHAVTPERKARCWDEYVLHVQKKSRQSGRKKLTEVSNKSFQRGLVCIEGLQQLVEGARPLKSPSHAEACASALCAT